jgi:hypothetical protein
MVLRATEPPSRSLVVASAVIFVFAAALADADSVAVTFRGEDLSVVLNILLHFCSWGFYFFVAFAVLLFAFFACSQRDLLVGRTPGLAPAFIV